MEQRNKKANRIRSVSRDTRSKFANETFWTVNIDNFNFDQVRGILPLSPGSSEFTSLNEETKKNSSKPNNRKAFFNFMNHSSDINSLKTSIASIANNTHLFSLYALPYI